MEILPSSTEELNQSWRLFILVKSLHSNAHGCCGRVGGGGEWDTWSGRRRWSLPLTCVGFYSFVFYGCCGGSLRKWKQPSGVSLPAQIRPDPQGPPGWAHFPDCGSLEKYRFPSHFLAPLEGRNTNSQKHHQYSGNLSVSQEQFFLSTNI